MNIMGYNIYYAWDLLGLYRQVFGHVGIPYSKVDVEKPRSVVSETGKPIEAWDGNTLEGLVFRESTLKGQSFLMPLTINDWQFPIEPLVSINGRKHIIETKVTGLKHPVIEDVAMESYRINIKGVFINEENDDYPYRDVARLAWLLEKKGSLPVVNKLLSTFGVDYVTIVDVKCDAVEGHQSMQWYVIEAVSDRPVELELEEGAA